MVISDNHFPRIAELDKDQLLCDVYYNRIQDEEIADTIW
jgi:hypothetical protein